MSKTGNLISYIILLCYVKYLLYNTYYIIYILYYSLFNRLRVKVLADLVMHLFTTVFVLVIIIVFILLFLGGFSFLHFEGGGSQCPTCPLGIFWVQRYWFHLYTMQRNTAIFFTETALQKDQKYQIHVPPFLAVLVI